MYFSCVRQRGGWNNNPSAAQFRHAYRQTLVHAAVVGSKNANVAAQLEGISLLKSQAHTSQTSSVQPKADEDPAPLVPAALDHDYFALSEYSAEVTKYIGGFIVQAVIKRLHCTECADLLVSETITSMLTFIKNNGGLTEPSHFVHTALHTAEQAIRITPPQQDQVQALNTRVFRDFAQHHDALLLTMPHYREEPHHVLNLTKVVMRKYITLRLRAIARRITEQSRGTYVRHVLTKQVLFAHQ